MKIRIKGNSVRYRLSKTDVDTITAVGYHEEHTLFGTATLTYALQRQDEATMRATFDNNKITVHMPASFLEDWATNTVVGCDARMPVPGGESLYILVEKDFKCLDDVMEDQSDNYDNPSQTC